MKPKSSTTDVVETPALDALRALGAQLPDGYQVKVCEDTRLEILEVKAAGGASGAGQLKGYASTFGNWDRLKERPVPGAFAQDMAEFLVDGFITVYHKAEGLLPIATITECYEDSIGLYVVADFHSTQAAQDARTVASERLARGKSVRLSIGYVTLDDEYVPDGRLLKRCKLYEISLVNIPANPMAAVASVKGLLGGLTLETHSDTVRAAVDEYIARIADLADIKTKEGRVLSTANVTRLSALKDALLAACNGIDEVLTAAEKQKADEAKDEKKADEATASEIDALAARLRLKRADLELQAARAGYRLN